MTIREMIILAAVVIVLAVGWRLHRDAIGREVARRVAAEQSVALAKDTTRIIERTMTHENTIYRQAEEAADAIQEQPGAATPIPDEQLSSWRRALDGLRDKTGADNDIGS